MGWMILSTFENTLILDLYTHSSFTSHVGFIRSTKFGRSFFLSMGTGMTTP
jgi:hypothetical protein